MGNKEEVNLQLYEKMKLEYEEFITDIYKMDKSEIIRHSYEIVFKDELVMCMSEIELPIEKAKALLETKNPLDECYHEWIKTDVSHMPDLRDVIDYRACRVHEYLKEKAPER